VKWLSQSPSQEKGKSFLHLVIKSRHLLLDKFWFIFPRNFLLSTNFLITKHQEDNESSQNLIDLHTTVIRWTSAHYPMAECVSVCVCICISMTFLLQDMNSDHSSKFVIIIVMICVTKCAWDHHSLTSFPVWKEINVYLFSLHIAFGLNERIVNLSENEKCKRTISKSWNEPHRLIRGLIQRRSRNVKFFLRLISQTILVSV